MSTVKDIGDQVIAAVKGYVARASATWEERFKQLEAFVKAIPAGPKGDKGEPGVNGRDGSEGLQGKEGAPGHDGKDGAAGRDGKDGTVGKAAYQLALERGFVGTELQWIDSLKGEKGKDGAQGRDGVNGKDGSNGLDGTRGDKGDSGERGADGLPGKDGAPGRDGDDGATGKDGERGVDGINGQDGAAGRDGVDGKDGASGLNGKDGAAGQDGINGKDGIRGEQGPTGKSAYQHAVERGFTGTEMQWLDSLQGRPGRDADESALRGLRDSVDAKVSEKVVAEIVHEIAIGLGGFGDVLEATPQPALSQLAESMSSLEKTLREPLIPVLGDDGDVIAARRGT